MNPFDIIIVTNSAGELSTYVKPTVEELNKSIPEARIILIFTPCQYATGKELEEARSFPGISEIIIPEEYKKWILKNKNPQGIRFNKSGIVLYLGGDLLHAMLLSRKLKYKAMAYTQKHALWQNDFELFMVPDQFTYDAILKKGVSKEKLKVIGDLMIDSVPEKIEKEIIAKKLKLNLNQPIISFLPGSRPFQTDFMLPFFLQSAKMIKKVMPETQFLFILSPYITDEMIKKSLKDEGVIYSQGDLKYIQAKNGIRAEVIRNNRYEAIEMSEIVITIPGTNTAEIASMGKPMIVVFPLNKPDSIPLEGVADWICRIPIIGSFIKRVLITWINTKTKFFALPNIKSEKDVVPELRGNVSAKEVAARTLKLIKDKVWLAKTSEDLKKIMGKRGASKKLVGEIVKQMEKNQ